MKRMGCMIAMGIGLAVAVQAQDGTWTGGAFGNLNNADNWTPDLPGAGDTAIWDGQDGNRTSYSAGANVGGTTTGWKLLFTENNTAESIFTNTGTTSWDWRLAPSTEGAPTLLVEEDAGAVRFGTLTGTDNPFRLRLSTASTYWFRNESTNAVTVGSNVDIIRTGASNNTLNFQGPGDWTILGDFSTMGTGGFGIIRGAGMNLTLAGDNSNMTPANFYIAGGTVTFYEAKNLPGLNSVVRMGHGGDAGTLLYIGSGDTKVNNQISLHSTTAPAHFTLDASGAGTGTIAYTNAVFTTGAGWAGSQAYTMTLTGDNTGANTISGEIANFTSTRTLGINKEGDGTWVLSGSNTYSGATGIYGGTLVAANDNAFGKGKTILYGNVRNSVLGLTGDIDLAGQRVDCQGRNDDYTDPTGGIRNLSGENTVYLNGVGGGTNYVFHAEKNSTLNADWASAVGTAARTYVFTGAGDINLIGNLTAHAAGTDGIGVYQNSTGTTTMNSTGLYEGTTVVKQGELVVSGRTGATTGGIIVDEGATLRGTANNSLRGAMDNSGTVIFDSSAGTWHVYENLGGNGTFIQRGGNELNLQTSNDLTGEFIIENGTVHNVADRLQSAQLNLDGGTMTFAGATDFTVGSLEGTSGLSLQTAAANAINLNVGGNDKSKTFSGVLSGKGGLTKNGNGIMTLSGPNTYAGDTIVNSGTLTLADGGVLTFVIGDDDENNRVKGTGAVSLNGTFVFDLTDADETVGNQWTIVEHATLAQSYGGTFEVDGFAAGAGGIWRLDIGDGSTWFEFDQGTGVLQVKDSADPADSPDIDSIGIVLENGNVLVTVAYEDAGAAQYILEFREDLLLGDWEPVATNEVPGSLIFIGDTSQGFFRIKAE